MSQLSYNFISTDLPVPVLKIVKVLMSGTKGQHVRFYLHHNMETCLIAKTKH